MFFTQVPALPVQLLHKFDSNIIFPSRILVHIFAPLMQRHFVVNMSLCAQFTLEKYVTVPHTDTHCVLVCN